MAVAKRQGREKPMKIEQTKIKGRSEDQSEDLRQNKQHSWLAQFAQGSPRWREKTLKEEPKHSPPAPHPACVGSFSLSLPPAGVLLHSSVHAFELACPHASRMDPPAIF